MGFEEKTITVNQLASILAKHFDVERANIDGIEYGSMFEPHHKPIGKGARLNIIVSLYTEEKDYEL